MLVERSGGEGVPRACREHLHMHMCRCMHMCMQIYHAYALHIPCGLQHMGSAFKHRVAASSTWGCGLQHIGLQPPAHRVAAFST